MRWNLVCFISMCIVGPAMAQDESEHRGSVMVELFTSQGCSSCPPADEVLSQLGELGFSDDEIVIAAYHVDYWDNLGWIDPFSHAHWTRRQRNYGRWLRAEQIYTPQMVIDGTWHFVGSNAPIAKKIIREALEAPDPATVHVAAATDGINGATLLVDVEIEWFESSPDNGVELFIGFSESGLETEVGRGENGGRLLKNDAVVRGLYRAGVAPDAPGMTGRSHRVGFPLKVEWAVENMTAFAFLQNLRSGEVVAAGKMAVGN